MAEAFYYAQVRYNANGGSGAPAAQSRSTKIAGGGVIITLSSGVPSRQYYTFKGWAYSSSATSGMSGGTQVSFNASTTPSAANAAIYTLYAAWQPETAVLSYNANGGSGAPSSQTVNKNTWFNLRTGVPTRSGYEFVGWNTSSTATAATYQPGDSARIVGNMTLYAVWKVSNSTISTITSSVPMDGSTTGTVTISTINASYSHTLTIALGSSSQTINIAAGTTTQTFTIPSAWVSEVPNATSATATATLKTYDGGTQIGGSDTKTFTVTVPASVVPSLTVAQTIVNSNATVAGWGILLQNYSQIKLTATATAGTGATVASYTFSGDGMSYSGSSNEQTSAVLTSSGSRTWTVKVTDSRGRTATVTSSATVHEYASPVISSLTAFRSDSGGNRDDAAGTYIKATGVFDYSSCDSHNSLSVDKIEYQAEDAGSWTLGQNNAASGTAYTFGSGSITETKTFHVKLTLTDALGNSADFTVDIAPIVGYGFGLKNDRVHFGGPCKEPGFVCDFPAKLVNGSVVASHTASGNYAKVVTFGANVTTGKNLAPTNSYNTARVYWGTNINSANILGQVLQTLSAGTYTISWKHTMTAVASATFQTGSYIRYYDGSSWHILASYSVTTQGSCAVDDVFEISRTITIGESDVGQNFEVLAYCGQDSGFKSTISEYQIEVGSQKTPFEPYVDITNMAIDAPVTMEYIRSSDETKTELTIVFNPDYSLSSFKSNNSADAYLHRSSASVWNLYIGKSNSSDSVEILDFHNPWSNTDMTVEWEDTSISTLPTGATQATGACKTGTMTLGNGASALGEIRVKQSGRVVNVSGYAQGTFSSGTTGYLLGTISGVDMPSNYIRAVGGCGSQNYYAYESAYLILDPSTGDFTARCSANSSYVTFNLTYIAD